jgi:hypothetical protein
LRALIWRRTLEDDVVDPQQVRLRRLELQLGQVALLLVPDDAGGFLDELAAVAGLGAEDRIDLALLDDGYVVAPTRAVWSISWMSRSRTRRPSRRYSLSPDRKRRRETTTVARRLGRSTGSPREVQGDLPPSVGAPPTRCRRR